MTNFQTLAALSGELQTLTSEAGGWVVSVQAGRGPNTSGVLWDSEHVLTVERRLGADDGIEVGLPDGRMVTASVLGRVPGWDLAFLKLSTPLDIASPPWSEKPTAGLVVSLGREARGALLSSLGMLSSVEAGLNHQSAYGPQFAGGPLLGHGGEFLGLNIHGRPPEAVPYSRLRDAVEQMREGRSVEPGFLGLGLLPLDNGGCLVVNVAAESPAATGRVLVGDQLFELDGTEVNGPEDVQRELRSLSPGRAITLSISRSGEQKQVEVVLGARPQRDFAGPARHFFKRVREAIIQHGGPCVDPGAGGGRGRGRGEGFRGGPEVRGGPQGERGGRGGGRGGPWSRQGRPEMC